MKSNYAINFVVVILVMFFNSCTLQKKLYLPGYYVETQMFKKKKSNDNTNIKDIDVQCNESYNIKHNDVSDIKENSIVACADISNKNLLLCDIQNKNTIIGEDIQNDANSGTKRSNNDKVFSISKNIEKNNNNALKSTTFDGETSWFAIAGFSASMIGLLLLFVLGWPFFLGTLGIVFSAIGLSQTSKGQKGKGFAIAGLILGILTVMLFWIFVAVISTTIL